MKTPTAAEIKAMLWDYGHFRNPACPTEVTKDDLPKLRLSSPEVVIAIKSFAGFMAPEFDRLAYGYHGRSAINDGIIGPAYRELFTVRRCGCPDFAMETGSGSWPVGCHSQWPDNHAFTVNVDKSRMPSFLGEPNDSNSIFEQAWSLCRLAYADIGIVFERDDGNRRANTTVTWEPGKGWIGLAIVPSNPRCGDFIWAKFDTRYSPAELRNQWTILLAHEFGHNMGMGHSRGGIMNASITNGLFTPTAWRGDPSEPLLTRFFGGEPVDLGGDDSAPDPPLPPDTPDVIELVGFTGTAAGRPALFDGKVTLLNAGDW